MTSKEALSTLNKYRNSQYNSVNEEEREMANALNVILPEYVKLLDRDTPKKPLLAEVSADNEHHYVCSFCNATINIGDSIGYNKVFNVFCRNCGQRLDWSESK